MKDSLKAALELKIIEVGKGLKEIVKEKCKKLEDYANLMLE